MIRGSFLFTCSSCGVIVIVVVIITMDMLVGLLRTLSVIVVWAMVVEDMVTAAVAIGFTSTEDDDDDGWRRQALRLMDVVGGTRSRNCTTTSSSSSDRMHIPSDAARRHLRRQYAAPLRSASQFVALLQSTLVESTAATDDRSAALYASFARAVVETDDVVRGCAVYVTTEDRTDFVPYAYRLAGASDRIDSANLVLLDDYYNESEAATSSSNDDVDEAESSIMMARMLAAVVRTFRDAAAANRTRVSLTSSSSSSSSTSGPLPEETWGAPFYNCTENAWFITYYFPLFAAERWRSVE